MSRSLVVRTWTPSDPVSRQKEAIPIIEASLRSRNSAPRPFTASLQNSSRVKWPRVNTFHLVILETARRWRRPLAGLRRRALRKRAGDRRAVAALLCPRPRRIMNSPTLRKQRAMAPDPNGLPLESLTVEEIGKASRVSSRLDLCPTRASLTTTRCCPSLPRLTESGSVDSQASSEASSRCASSASRATRRCCRDSCRSARLSVRRLSSPDALLQDGHDRRLHFHPNFAQSTPRKGVGDLDHAPRRARGAGQGGRKEVLGQ